MDKAVQNMINNLHEKTGKTLEQWVEIVNKENLEKHGQIVKFLKEKHNITHGYANLIAHSANNSAAASVENKDELVNTQYKDKEHFRPVYDHLINDIKSFGSDVEISPKKEYVSLRRDKQFATLKPATKSRFEIGINLKGQRPSGVLEEIKSANAMCSHKINIKAEDDINDEVIYWLKSAYDKAGK